jgi:cbb3-type cytochrome oxidase subunit 3
MPMKRTIILILFIELFLGLIFFSLNQTGIVYASMETPISSLTPTPTPQLIEATATVDPESIGDTSGVIAIGTIVVFIILAGVVWGTLELRQEALKSKPPKE